MVAQTLNLEQAMKEFENKWGKIRDSDSKIDDDARREVYNTLRSACADLLKAWNAWKDFTEDPEWIVDSREDVQSILKALR